jgi:hypothetical protein
MNITLPAGVAFQKGFVTVCPGFGGNVAIFLSQADFQVLRSTDAGTSWSNITGDLGGWHMAQFSHTGAIAFRPNAPDEIYVGARGILRTTNGGTNWGSVTDTHADITTLLFDPASGNDKLWIGCDGGIIQKTIGGAAVSWNGDATNGLRCFQVDFMDAARGIRTIGCQDNGTNYTTNFGALWKYTADGDGLDCEITNDLSMEFWHSGIEYGIPNRPPNLIHRTRVGSLTDTNNMVDGMEGLFYNRLVNWIYSIGDDDNIYGCNVGASPLSWVVDGTIPSEFRVRRFPTGSYVDGATLYGDTTDPTDMFGIPTILIMRLGAQWNTTRFDFGGSGSVQNIYASTENAGEVWATMSRNSVFQPLIFHSRDHGVSWTDVSGDLSGLKIVRCLVQKPFEPHVLWIGTDIGVFQTVDGGASWQPFQEGLPIGICTDLRYIVDPAHAGNDKLVVTTYGRGLYERDVPSFPLAYVSPDDPTTTEDGTYEHPFDTFLEGTNSIPDGGSLGLRGGSYFPGLHVTFNAPLTLRAYGGAAVIGQ